MDPLNNIRMLFQGHFYILDGRPEYITLEQVQTDSEIFEDFDYDLHLLLERVEEWGLNRIGTMLIKETESYDDFAKTLLRNGFELYTSKVNVKRDLMQLPDVSSAYTAEKLTNQTFSEQEFKLLWENCMAGSDNTPTTLTINEHLQSLKSELGTGWEESCYVLSYNKKPGAITIPHIEPGTISEGRLFYFGLLPEVRGQGLSKTFHLQSLHLLKGIGASYYIGSTHLSNHKMQHVFKHNKCHTFIQTASFYKYLK